MSATLTDPAITPVYYQPFFDSFDTGIVNFPDTWNVDTSVAGQITLHSPEYYLTSGMMEATGSADMGHGYGTYTINAMLEGIYPGSAIMLWNAPNEWPLSEIDIAETSEAGDGQQYAALHWDDNGQDRFSQLWYDPAIRPGVAHTYQAVWEPDRITMKVDGVTQAVFTVAVPKDFADGGWNHVFAFYNNKPETSLTVYDVKYEPLGTSTPATPPPPCADAPRAAPAAGWWIGRPRRRGGGELPADRPVVHPGGLERRRHAQHHDRDAPAIRHHARPDAAAAARPGGQHRRGLGGPGRRDGGEPRRHRPLVHPGGLERRWHPRRPGDPRHDGRLDRLIPAGEPRPRAAFTALSRRLRRAAPARRLRRRPGPAPPSGGAARRDVPGSSGPGT